MVLRICSFILLAMIGGCATAGYERYGTYDEKRDSIYQHRASFVGDGGIGMAYAVVYWEALKGKTKGGERPPEVYYIWLRNNRSLPVTIDPGKLSLFTEKGAEIPISSLTGETILPLKMAKLEPRGSVGGYVAFDVPRETMEKDKPSRLVYDDDEGNRAVRYLLIDDMKRYEGLILEASPRYYAPVYPREYWYPYYYPYVYYPYDLRFHLFYRYDRHRDHYYYSPSEPKKRRFYTPSPSPSQEEEPKSRKKRRREFK
jgi:hypothetical protein